MFSVSCPWLCTRLKTRWLEAHFRAQKCISVELYRWSFVGERRGEEGNEERTTQRGRERGDSRRNTEEERYLTQRAQRTARVFARRLSGGVGTRTKRSSPRLRRGRGWARRAGLRGVHVRVRSAKLMRELSTCGYSMSIGMYRLVFECEYSNAWRGCPVAAAGLVQCGA